MMTGRCENMRVAGKCSEEAETRQTVTTSANAIQLNTSFTQVCLFWAGKEALRSVFFNSMPFIKKIKAEVIDE